MLTFHPGFMNRKREKSLASLPSFPISLFCHKVWIRFLFSCACERTNYLRNIQLRLSVLLLQGVGDQDESQVLFPDCQSLALTLFPALGVVQREAFTQCLTLGGTGEACRQITSWQTCHSGHVQVRGHLCGVSSFYFHTGPGDWTQATTTWWEPGLYNCTKT